MPEYLIVIIDQTGSESWDLESLNLLGPGAQYSVLKTQSQVQVQTYVPTLDLAGSAIRTVATAKSK